MYTAVSGVFVGTNKICLISFFWYNCTCSIWCLFNWIISSPYNNTGMKWWNDANGSSPFTPCNPEASKLYAVRRALVILCWMFSSPVFARVVERLMPGWVVEFTCASFVPFNSKSMSPCFSLLVHVGLTVTETLFTVLQAETQALESLVILTT